MNRHRYLRDEVVDLLAKGTSYYDIFEYLLRRGLSPKEMNSVVRRAEYKATRVVPRLRRRRIIWVLLLGLCLWLLFGGLPLRIFVTDPISVGITFALLIPYLLVQSIFDYPRWKTVDSIPDPINWRSQSIVLFNRFVIPVCAFAAFIYSASKPNIVSRQNGVLVEASILPTNLDKFTQDTSQKVEFHLQCITLEGDTLLDTQRPKGHIDPIYPGKKFMVTYLPEFPNDFLIILSNQTIEKKLGRLERAPKPHELLQLLQGPPEQVLPFLDSLGYGWEATATGWQNLVRDEWLTLYGTDSLVFYATASTVNPLLSQIDELGFEIFKGPKGSVDVVSDGYRYQSHRLSRLPFLDDLQVPFGWRKLTLTPVSRATEK